ncbi:MAG: polyprenyl synthetase family protein [Deltaproteobacteria bacterium]|nr:polyprenyl synthetase family protein [Deltaproteobacteria bacterium]
MREAKALRPALCIATCRALGGQLAAVLPSAAMLELFHNAFLIHDDVEDDSELRRGAPTFHRAEECPDPGMIPAWGDGMLALALRPLLDNTRTVRARRSAADPLELVARMARESAEGRRSSSTGSAPTRGTSATPTISAWCTRRPSWYSFITPVLLEALVGGVEPARLARLGRFATLLGLTFRVGTTRSTSTPTRPPTARLAGDLSGSKRTLILLHALRAASPGERARTIGILAKRRPGAGISELEAKSVADVEFLRASWIDPAPSRWRAPPRGGAPSGTATCSRSRPGRRRAVVAPRLPVRRGALRDRAGSLSGPSGRTARRGAARGLERSAGSRLTRRAGRAPATALRRRRASLGADPGATADDAASARTPADTRATPAGQEPDAGSLGERARAHFADLQGASASRLSSPATSSTRCAGSAPRSSSTGPSAAAAQAARGGLAP